MNIFHPARLRGSLSLVALLALGACDSSGQMDLDLRDNMGNAFDTSASVRTAVASPPRPDNRGIVSYPTYQVAIARRGDTVGDVAARVGLPAAELAEYNGLPRNVALRRGEIVALPRRVSEPSPATGSATTGPIRIGVPGATTGLAAPGAVLTQSLEDRASSAIAPGSPGVEPTRHKVARGETAFSISRRYDVPTKALADWNGLDAAMKVREGQYLLIPVVGRVPTARRPEAPGVGSRAPVPPSAAQPLPDEEANQDAPDTPTSPDLGSQTTAQSAPSGKFIFPVSGAIIRPFSKGRNDGIDISATPGTPVQAADSGTVAAITRDTDQIPILVLRHPGNVLTVYAGVEGINVQKGQSVKRGQAVARVRDANPSFLHFEVREGFDSVDPIGYLQ